MLKPSQVKDHSRFADRVLRVSNVPLTSGERGSVFVVLMGAAGYVQAYNGLRRHPNVVFEADVTKGTNSRFVNVKVKTPNGVGALADLAVPMQTTSTSA